VNAGPRPTHFTLPHVATELSLMSYFVSPREETDLRVDAKGLAAAIQSQWDHAELRFPANPDSNHALESVVWRADRRLEGSLDKTGQVLHLSGDVEDCAHFPTWCRGLVRARYGLAFHHEGYSADVELAVGTNELALTEPFLAR
jgi:hypothetical protein